MKKHFGDRMVCATMSEIVFWQQCSSSISAEMNALRDPRRITPIVSSKSIRLAFACCSFQAVTVRLVRILGNDACCTTNAKSHGYLRRFPLNLWGYSPCFRGVSCDETTSMLLFLLEFKFPRNDVFFRRFRRNPLDWSRRLNLLRCVQEYLLWYPIGCCINNRLRGLCWCQRGYLLPQEVFFLFRYLFAISPADIAAAALTSNYQNSDSVTTMTAMKSPKDLSQIDQEAVA